MKNPLPTIARAIPLLAGPALLLIPSGEAEQLLYVRRLLLLVLLFTFVGAVKFLLVRLYSGGGKHTGPTTEERVGKYRKRPLLNRGREVIEIIVLIVCTFLMLASLQSFLSASPAEVFPIVVVAILAGAIESRLTALGSFPIGAMIAAVVSGGAVAGLSIFLSIEQWPWQTLMIGLAYGAVAGAQSLASAIERSATTAPTRRRVLARGLIITLVLAPALFGALVQLQELSLPYLLTFLMIPALSPVFRALRAYEETGTTPPRLRVSVAAASLLFVVIVCGVSVVYPG